MLFCFTAKRGFFFRDVINQTSVRSIYEVTEQGNLRSSSELRLYLTQAVYLILLYLRVRL